MKINSKIIAIQPDLPALVWYQGFFYIAFEKISEISYKTLCLFSMEIFNSYRDHSVLDGNVIKNPEINMDGYESLIKEKSPIYPCVRHFEKYNITAIWLEKRKAIYFNFFSNKTIMMVNYLNETEEEMNKIEQEFHTVKNPKLSIYGSILTF